MPESVCLLCKGQSWTEQIVGTEVVPYRCICFKRRLALSFLGSELAKVPHRRSALYCVEKDSETGDLVGDRTLENLFIKGAWDEVSQHLRWAVGAKHYDSSAFTFKLVNDEMLLRVKLGDFSYGNRSKQVRDEIVTYNNLTDLIADCSLLVVRLGMLVHSNRAAANVLLEVLNLRAAAAKPTWLIEGKVPFGDGHPFYNYAVGSYIDEHYETINVGGDVESERRMEAELQALNLSSQALGVDDSDRVSAPKSQERYIAEPGAWENERRRPNPRWSKGQRKNGGLEQVKL